MSVNYVDLYLDACESIIKEFAESMPNTLMTASIAHGARRRLMIERTIVTNAIMVIPELPEVTRNAVLKLATKAFDNAGEKFRSSGVKLSARDLFVIELKKLLAD